MHPGLGLSGLLGPHLVYLFFLGAYGVPPAVFLWVFLMALAGMYGSRRPRLVALVCMSAGIAVSLVGFFIVLPSMLPP